MAEQAERGTSYGATTELEVELATLITQAIPSLEKIRFVSSGTEATMSAVRLARGVTKRDFLLKFEGCYHGHADSFLSQAGSGLATLGIADCPGVPQALAALTLNAPYNDLSAVEQVFAEHKNEIAAVIIEPIAANMGVVEPAPGFLAGLREITKRNGALLIVDEVITGFRMHYGAAQQLLGVQGDLTTLGKIIGGGLPVAAYGGSAELMNHVAPLGPVYQAGTLAGNPLAMRAGIATLKELTLQDVYEGINEQASRLVAGLRQALVDSGKAGPSQCDRFPGDAFLYNGRQCATTTTPSGRTQNGTRDFSARCWIAVSFLRLLSLKLRLYARRIRPKRCARTIAAARDSLQAISAGTIRLNSKGGAETCLRESNYQRRLTNMMIIRSWFPFR